MNKSSYLDDGRDIYPQPTRERQGFSEGKRSGHTTEYVLATVVLLMLVLAILGV